jgi:hypothetical protein
VLLGGIPMTAMLSRWSVGATSEGVRPNAQKRSEILLKVLKTLDFERKNVLGTTNPPGPKAPNIRRLGALIGDRWAENAAEVGAQHGLSSTAVPGSGMWIKYGLPDPESDHERS